MCPSLGKFVLTHLHLVDHFEEGGGSPTGVHGNLRGNEGGSGLGRLALSVRRQNNSWGREDALSTANLFR